MLSLTPAGNRSRNAPANSGGPRAHALITLLASMARNEAHLRKRVNAFRTNPHWVPTGPRAFLTASPDIPAQESRAPMSRWVPPNALKRREDTRSHRA